MHLSTFAIDGSDSAPRQGAGLVRYADLPLLAVALAVFIAAELPLLGFAAAAVTWIAQRAVLHTATRRTQAALAAGDRRTAFRTTAVSTLGRVWLVCTAVLLVGLFASREDGLAAAVLVAALFTAQFAGNALFHLLSPDRKAAESR